eukprot:1161425-Pelagomonas_calceolata.AAC.3
MLPSPFVDLTVDIEVLHSACFCALRHGRANQKSIWAFRSINGLGLAPLHTAWEACVSRLLAAYDLRRHEHRPLH